MKKLLLLSPILLSQLANAQWANNGVAVGTGSNNQWKAEITAGAVGDSYLTWSDALIATNDYNVHVSRLRSDGFIMWTQVICNSIGNQETPQIVTDGMGGAIIAWHDERGGVSNYSVYAQRIDSNGVVQWTANGVQASNVISSSMTKPRIIEDGYSGVFVVFHNQTDVYAQNLNQNGIAQWGVSGVNLSAALVSTAQDDPELCTDNSYGIIVSWENNGNIQAQHLSSTGVEQWGTAGTGIVICNASLTQDIPNISSDGNGGALIAWEDDRNGTTATAIFAQLVSSTGTPSWTGNGVQVGETGLDCRWRAPNTDGHNNNHIVQYSTDYFIVYEVYNSSITDYSIFARRVNGITGAALGLTSVSNSPIGDETEARAILNGAGKIIITWDLQDTVTSTIHHIRTVTLDNLGIKTYDFYVADGNVVGGGDRSLPVVCASGCFAIYGWHDSRGTGTWDAYASSSQILNAPIGNVPSAPSVNGPINVCAGSTALTYSCSTIPTATNYNWTFPVGWTIMSGQGTTIVVVTAGTTGGTISVTASNNCGTSPAGTMTVNVNPNPTVTITNTPASCPTCCDGTATANPSGGTPPYTYLWTPGGQVTQTATALCVMCQTLTVTDANGCTVQDTTCISFTVGTSNLNTETNEISVYPNPASGFFVLSGVDASGQAIIYNAIGEQIGTWKLISGNNKIDVSKLPKGIYFVQIKTGDTIVTKKIIIQ